LRHLLIIGRCADVFHCLAQWCVDLSLRYGHDRRRAVCTAPGHTGAALRVALGVEDLLDLGRELLPIVIAQFELVLHRVEGLLSKATSDRVGQGAESPAATAPALNDHTLRRGLSNNQRAKCTNDDSD